MSREIKFRALYEGEWYYQTLEEIITITLAAFRLGKHKTQYTGLKDKHGKEIYEGDLITITDPYNDNTAKGVAKVIFSTNYVGGWVASVSFLDSLNIGTRTNYVKVIGNIYENPELIGK